jgi:hypothetical protein
MLQTRRAPLVAGRAAEQRFFDTQSAPLHLCECVQLATLLVLQCSTRWQPACGRGLWGGHCAAPLCADDVADNSCHAAPAHLYRLQVHLSGGWRASSDRAVHHRLVSAPVEAQEQPSVGRCAQRAL